MRNVSVGIACFVSVAMLGGCTTLSFAPPSVELTEKRMRSSCAPDRIAASSRIDPNQEGAYALTDNFIYSYRCAQREAADGRQAFQVPSFLALIASTLGPTFGGSDDARIAMAAYGATLDRANGYYAPKDKAAILDHGLDALVCIKNEQVGVDFFNTQSDPAADAEAKFLTARANDVKTEIETLEATDKTWMAAADAQALGKKIADLRATRTTLVDLAGRKAAAASSGPVLLQRQTAGGTVNVDVQRTYFNMVSSALLSVERVMGKRLSESGSPDPEAFAALLKKLNDEADAAKIDKGDAAPSNTKSLTTYSTEKARDAAYLELSLDALKKAMQVCVLRAKMA